MGIFVMLFLGVALIFAFLYVAAVRAAWVNAKSGWLKWSAMLIMVGPAMVLFAYWGGEIAQKQWRFHQLCEREGGLKVYLNDLPPVKVLRLESDYGPDSAERFLQEYPGLVVEAPGPDYTHHMERFYSRYEKKAGHINITPIDKVVITVDGKAVVLEKGKSLADYSLILDGPQYQWPVNARFDRLSLHDRNGMRVATSSFGEGYIKQSLAGWFDMRAYCHKEYRDLSKQERDLLSLIHKKYNQSL